MQRRVVTAITGVGLLTVAALLYALDAGGPQLGGVSIWAWIAGGIGAVSLLSAWWRR